MNTRYEAEYYDEKLLEADIGNILESMKKRWKGKKLSKSILICHEWIAKEGAIYPLELLQKLLEKFTWILNGHMHFYAKNLLRNVAWRRPPSTKSCFMWRIVELDEDVQTRKPPSFFVLCFFQNR